MVEANPLAGHGELMDDLEDRVFAHQDEKMEQHFNESKDLIQQLIDKGREIAEGNMREILAYRSDLRDVRARFKSMFADNRATGQDIRAELAAIT